MTDVSVAEVESQAVGLATGVDDELVAQLVARAQADGLRLTGEGGAAAADEARGHEPGPDRERRETLDQALEAGPPAFDIAFDGRLTAAQQ
ncbi:hypothetical protein [Streptomyces sp. NPDC055692]|uniref:hypothetical protein n=1 Tax=Streptomyces sp. NPDC055692 TaxID=3155683 RepID=UPI00342BE637